MRAKPDLIGSRDVCRIFEIDKSTLSRWVAAGKLTPALRLNEKTNGAFLFHRKDVEKLRAA
jgi:predicted site-specific integrase-resolvase